VELDLNLAASRSSISTVASDGVCHTKLIAFISPILNFQCVNFSRSFLFSILS
jgi:hypothetical protein